MDRNCSLSSVPPSSGPPRRRSILASLLLASVGAAAVAIAWALLTQRLVIPDEHNPWAPLRVEQAPNWLTPYKLARAKGDVGLCQAIVRTTVPVLGWDAVALRDRQTGPGCGFQDAWRIDRTGLGVGAPFSLACPSVLALAMWERHTLQPAAHRHFGQPLSRLSHLGSYACRNTYGRADTPRSRHATAEALDVAGFALANGRTISVLKDWGRAPAPEEAAVAAFLRDARDGACTWFDGVLSPDHNAAHADHLHLEAGGWKHCQ